MTCLVLDARSDTTEQSGICTRCSTSHMAHCSVQPYISHITFHFLSHVAAWSVSAHCSSFSLAAACCKGSGTVDALVVHSPCLQIHRHALPTTTIPIALSTSNPFPPSLPLLCTPLLSSYRSTILLSLNVAPTGMRDGASSTAFPCLPPVLNKVHLYRSHCTHNNYTTTIFVAR